MVTTIQVSNELLNTLKKRKINEKDSYEEIIWDLLEDNMELSLETKKQILKSESDAKAGRIIPLSEVKKRVGL